jgi:hypothetical protein
MTLLKRLTLVIDDGIIKHVFYPVFPPDRNASDVLAWLKAAGSRRFGERRRPACATKPVIAEPSAQRLESAGTRTPRDWRSQGLPPALSNARQFLLASSSLLNAKEPLHAPRAVLICSISALFHFFLSITGAETRGAISRSRGRTRLRHQGRQTRRSRKRNDGNESNHPGARKRSKPSGANVPIPADAKVIDLSKSTVLPGLFDAHTHLCMTVKKDRDGQNYYITTLLDPTPYRAIEGVANARDMLAAGFTTVRDVGNNGNYADTALREAIERGVVPGPTMINAGRIIAPYGGQFQLQPEKRDLATPEYAFADTRDEMIKAIRENIHYGATVIKIVVDDQKYIYSADDIRFMVRRRTATD